MLAHECLKSTQACGIFFRALVNLNVYVSDGWKKLSQHLFNLINLLAHKPRDSVGIINAKTLECKAAPAFITVTSVFPTTAAATGINPAVCRTPIGTLYHAVQGALGLVSLIIVGCDHGKTILPAERIRRQISRCYIVYRRFGKRL